MLFELRTNERAYRLLWVLISQKRYRRLENTRNCQADTDYKGFSPFVRDNCNR